MNKISSIFHILISISLIYSGAIHAVQPYYFIHKIASYQLLPWWLVGVAGLILPYMQVVLGCSILLGVEAKASFVSASALFALFAVAQASVLWRGLQIECGCFGFVSSEVSLFTLSIPLMFFIVTAWLYIAECKTPTHT